MAFKKKTERAKPVEKKIDYNRAENIICKHLFDLSDEQQNEIRKTYANYKDILQLTKDIHGDKSLTEDSDEYKSVKNFIVRIHSGTLAFNYSEEQINFIADSGEEMTATEIVRNLFPDKDGGVSQEIKTAVALLKAFGVEYRGKPGETKVAGPYVPPHTDHKIIALINRSNPSANYSLGNLDSDKRKCIASLKRHLCSKRFCSMASAIRSLQHRDVFQTEFISAVADKPDLTPEEINGYMNLANEYVLSLLITDQIANLNDRLQEATDDDEDGRKYTKNISDSLSTKAKEYHDCQNRMRSLHDDLAGKRSDRLKYSIAANESLSKYIELCRLEEGRAYLAKLGEKRNKEIHQEAKRIESLADLVMEIKGVSIEEILKYNDL